MYIFNLYDNFAFEYTVNLSILLLGVYERLENDVFTSV